MLGYRITRRRGDTFPIEFPPIRDAAGDVVDIAGASFILTVHELEEPTTAGGEEFSLVGSIVSPSSAGLITFTPAPTDVDRVGRFFYDVEMITAAGKTETVFSGRFDFVQDITKGFPGQVWTPDAADVAPVDGVDVPFWGEDFWFIGSESMAPGTTIKYATRAGESVIRVQGVAGSSGPHLFPVGPNSALQAFPATGIHEITVETYLDAPISAFGINSANHCPYGIFYDLMTLSSGQVYAYVEGYDRDQNDFYFDKTVNPGHPSTPGWITHKWLIDQTNKRSAFKWWAGRIADEGSTPWALDVSSPTDDQGAIPMKTLGNGSLALYPVVSGSGVVDIRTWKWEKIG